MKLAIALAILYLYTLYRLRVEKRKMKEQMEFYDQEMRNLDMSMDGFESLWEGERITGAERPHLRLVKDGSHYEKSQM